MIPQVRNLVPADWPDVARIYADGIATGNATFDTEPPAWAQWDRSHRPDLRFVATDEAGIAGWAAATSVSSRCCYAGVVESSIYVDCARRGRGVGRLLLSHLVDAAEAAGIWTVQAGIFPENIASVRLHKLCGFRIVGRRERLGQLRGVWRDVLLMERRST